MSDACFLSPPVHQGRAAMERHLAMLRDLNQADPLVRLAIEDTEILLNGRPQAG
jgi:hypothetical protein